MKYPGFFLLLIFISCIITVKAQVSEKNDQVFLPQSIVIDTCPLPVFQETINLNGTAAGCTDMKVTPDKGYIIAGQYIASPVSPTPIRGFLIKLNPFGAIDWQKGILFNTVSSNYFLIEVRRVIITNDSGYVLLIHYNGGYLGEGNMIIKFDKYGGLLWKKKLDFQYSGIVIMDGTATSDNGIAFTAIGSAAGFFVCKMNDLGNIVWSNIYSTSAGSYLNAKGIIELNSSLYLVGAGYAISGLSYVNTLIKIEKNNGQLNWCKSFGNPSVSSELALNTITMVNGKLVVGGMFDVNQTITKQGIFHFSENGLLEKAIKIQNGNSAIYSDNLYHSPPVAEDGYYASNSILYYDPNTNTFNDTSACILKLDTAGQLKWKWKYPWPGRASIVSVKNTSDGGFVAVGPLLGGYGAGNSSIHIIKGDTSGLTGGCNLENPHLIVNTVTLDTASVSFPVIPIQVFVIDDTDMIAIETNFTKDVLCSANSECANIKIMGEATICNKELNYSYKIIKDTACHQPALWQVSDTSIAHILSQTDTTLTIKYLKKGTVKIFAKFQFECTFITDSLSVQIFSTPDTLNLGPDLNLCSNGFFKLNAHSGYQSYLWQNGSTDSTYTVTVPGLYFVQVIDSCGNILKDTVTAFAAPPEFLDIGNDTTICRKDTITLNATAGFISYNWMPNYNITSTSGAATRVFPYTDTMYRIVATKRPGCTLLDSIKIYLHQTPIIKLGNDTSICNGTSIVLNAGTGFQSYNWSTGDISQQITVSQKRTYTVLATDINSCSVTDTLEIVLILPNPVVRLSKDSAICQNTSIQLDAGTGYVSYLWQDGSTNRIYIINSIGKFWVNVKDNYGCIGISDTTDIKFALSNPTHFIFHDTTICKYETLTLQPFTGYDKYLWSTNEITNKILVNKEGQYWLSVTDVNGCQGKEYITVISKDCKSDIYFPNSFSPNNDGTNDFFKPSVFGVMEKYHISIYNRYGQLIFYTDNWLHGWDGKFLSQPQNAGGYLWIASYTFKGKASETQKGSMLLLR